MSLECEFKADFPLSYPVEEGEINSGATSPATVVEANSMDTGVQTITNLRAQSPCTSERQQSDTQSEQEQRVTSLIVQVDNSNESEVQYKTLSERRKDIASKAKQVRYHPNHQPVAQLSYQCIQVNASQLCQSIPVITSTLQQIYYTNPYTDGNQYPPKPIFPPPSAFNPAMPEPMPKPNTELNGTTPIHNQTRPHKNPIVEHYKQVQIGEIANTRPNILRFSNAVTPRSNHPKSFFRMSTYEQSPNVKNK